MNKTLFVYDDFLGDPNAMRTEARRIRYHDPEKVFLVSDRSSFAGRLESRFTRLVRAKVEWASAAASGTYRKTVASFVSERDAEIVVHSEGPYNVVGQIYLSRPEDCHGGTALFRHKRTGLEGLHDAADVKRTARRLGIKDAELRALVWRDAKVASKWELTDLVQMRFNRLIVFNSQRFHSHVFDFSRVGRQSVRLAFTSYGTCRSPRWCDPAPSTP